MKESTIKIFKITMLVLFILIMIFLTIKFLPIFKSIATEEGRINFKQEIEGMGVNGIFAIVRAYVCANFSSNFATENL